MGPGPLCLRTGSPPPGTQDGVACVGQKQAVPAPEMGLYGKGKVSRPGEGADWGGEAVVLGGAGATSRVWGEGGPEPT